MFKAPTEYRVSGSGNNGAFNIRLSGRSNAYVIASDGGLWEHVSVHIIADKQNRTPTWAEMCKIKDMFWDDDDCVVQFHPPKSDYVNNHKHCLHLWRPIGQEIPRPDPLLVGIKNE